MAAPIKVPPRATLLCAIALLVIGLRVRWVAYAGCALTVAAVAHYFLASDRMDAPR